MEAQEHSFVRVSGTFGNSIRAFQLRPSPLEFCLWSLERAQGRRRSGSRALEGPDRRKGGVLEPREAPDTGGPKMQPSLKKHSVLV